MYELFARPAYFRLSAAAPGHPGSVSRAGDSETVPHSRRNVRLIKRHIGG